MDYLFGNYSYQPLIPAPAGRSDAFVTSEEHSTLSWRCPNFSVSAMTDTYAPDSCLYFMDQEKTLIAISGYPIFKGRALVRSSNASVQPITAAIKELLDCYFREGNQAFQNLNGSFALIIYQAETNNLHIITDRFNSRPVFYCHHPDRRVNFSTDIRILLSDPETPRDLDVQSIVEYLRFQMIFGERTLYSKILVFPPCSSVTISERGITIQRYFAFDYDESWGLSDEEYVEQLSEAFRQSVKYLCEEDNETGLMLSGGLDSRMAAAALLAEGHSIKAVTFGGFYNEEVLLAQRVAQAVHFPFHFIQREPDYYLNILEKAVQISNGLYVYHHAHMLGVHQQIHQLGIRTLIHGWGLDVPFSGSYFPKRQVRHLPGRSFFLVWPKHLRDQEDIVDSVYAKLILPSDNLTKNLMPGFTDIWQDWPRHVITEAVKESERHANDLYNRFDHVILNNFGRFRSYLYPMSVRWGVRERCPMYDSNLVHLYLSLPPRIRFCSRAYGRALERINPSLSKISYSRTGTSIRSPEIWQTISYFLLPARRSLEEKWRHIRKRARDYAAETYDSYPKLELMAKNEKYHHNLQKFLSDGVLRELNLVNWDIVQVMLKNQAQKPEYSEQLAALLSLNLWLCQQSTTA